MFLNENFTPIVLLLFFAKTILIIYYIEDYKKLKKRETTKLTYLDKEINLEKLTALNLKKSSQEINLLSKKTDIKVQEIKVKIIDINFCLSEIW